MQTVPEAMQDAGCKMHDLLLVSFRQGSCWVDVAYDGSSGTVQGRGLIGANGDETVGLRIEIILHYTAGRCMSFRARLLLLIRSLCFGIRISSFVSRPNSAGASKLGSLLCCE
jgi:hypothetical protein